MTAPRRTYEAKVLAVPCGPAGDRVLEAAAACGLTGIGYLERLRAENGHAGRYRLQAIGGGWAAAHAAASTLADLVALADVAVLVVGDLREVQPGLPAAVEKEARASGDLLAAVLVDDGAHDATARQRLAELREHVDMLVNVRSARLAAGFLDVVRGGRRELEQAAS